MLTEEHLTNSLQMKLGPALKFRRILSNKLGGPCPCVSCVQKTQILAAQSLSVSNLAASSTKCQENIKEKDENSELISLKDNLEICGSTSPSASADSFS